MARYIDADELYRKVKTATNPYGKPTIDYESGVKILNMIKRMPTVKVDADMPLDELEVEFKVQGYRRNSNGELDGIVVDNGFVLELRDENGNPILMNKGVVTNLLGVGQNDG